MPTAAEPKGIDVGRDSVSTSGLIPEEVKPLMGALSAKLSASVSPGLQRENKAMPDGGEYAIIAVLEFRKQSINRMLRPSSPTPPVNLQAFLATCLSKTDPPPAIGMTSKGTLAHQKSRKRRQQQTSTKHQPALVNDVARPLAYEVDKSVRAQTKKQMLNDWDLVKQRKRDGQVATHITIAAKRAAAKVIQLAKENAMNDKKAANVKAMADKKAAAKASMVAANEQYREAVLLLDLQKFFLAGFIEEQEQRVEELRKRCNAFEIVVGAKEKRATEISTAHDAAVEQKRCLEKRREEERDR